MDDRELEQLGVLAAVAGLNDDLQEWINRNSDGLSPVLLRMLTDLDWVVRNGYERTRRRMAQELRREEYRRPGNRIREQAERAWGRVLDLVTVTPPGPEDPRRAEREEIDRTDYAEVDLKPAAPEKELTLLDGHVWCETHRVVHEDSTDAFGGTCDALDRRDLYVDRGDG